MYRNLLVLLIFMLGYNSFAQQKWTLNSCISYSIENNLTAKNAAISNELANVAYSQTKWNYLPEIYAGSTAGMNYGRSIDPNTNGVIKTSFLSNSYYVNASLDLFKGFSQMNALAYQKYLLISAESSQRRVEDEIAFSVMNAFFDVAYFKELVTIAQEQRNLSKLNLKKTEILVSNGLKAEADLLEVKANVEKDELYYIQAQNQQVEALINLRKAMNIEASVQLELETPQDSVVAITMNDVNIDSLFQVYSLSSPQLNSLENEWKASLKNISLKKSGYYPSLSLEASYGTGYYETSKDTLGKTYAYNYQFKNNQSEYIGLSLVVPIFRKNEVRSNVKQAKLQSELNKNLLDKAKQDIQLEIVENVNSLIAVSRELKQAHNQLEADRLAFEAAQKKYDKGMISVVDFYTAKNRLSTTQGQVLRARLTLEIKKRTIDFYKGIRFWED